MRIQTALLERNTRLLSLCFRSEFHVLVPCFLRGAQGTCCPRLTSTTGRSLQKHSQDPGFQNIREPLARFPSMRTRPVSPGRRVQSFNLSPSARRVKGWAAVTFRLSSARYFLQRLQSTGLPALGQGRFSRFPSPGPARRRFRRQPYKIPAYPTPVNPGRKHHETPHRSLLRLVPKGVPSINARSRGVNPRDRRPCWTAGKEARTVIWVDGAAARTHPAQGE